MIKEVFSASLFDIDNLFPDIEMYLFGSILNNEPYINDLDILIVYFDKSCLSDLKDKLFVIGERIPLDVTYMHVDEEKEFNFIKDQGAKKLSSLW